VKIFKTTKRNIKVTLENMGTVEVGLGVCVGREEGGRSGGEKKTLASYHMISALMPISNILS
jgi:hypothetical protein